MRVQGTQYYPGISHLRNRRYLENLSVHFSIDATNQFDSNAVEVILAESEKTLGYVPRFCSREVNFLLRNGVPYEARVLDWSKEGRPIVDISVNFDSIGEVESDLRGYLREISELPCKYAIYNISNFRVYIGECQNEVRRLTEHIQSLDAGRHYNIQLQEDWSSLGSEMFSYHRFDAPAGQDQISELALQVQYGSQEPCNGYNAGDGWIAGNPERPVNSVPASPNTRIRTKNRSGGNRTEISDVRSRRAGVFILWIMLIGIFTIIYFLFQS